MFGGVSLLLSIFIAGIYCHVGAKFSTQPDHDSDDSNLNNNTIDRHVNIEIMNKASNTTNLNKLAESNPTSRESSIEICPPITLTQSAAVTKRKNLALNSASIDNIMKSLKEIFKNPIFFCIVCNKFMLVCVRACYFSFYFFHLNLILLLVQKSIFNITKN